MKKIIKAWESFSGWYWFAISKDIQDTVLDGQTYQDDTIWSGFVQRFEEEWSSWS